MMNFQYFFFIFFCFKLCQTVVVPKPTTSLRHLKPNDKSLLSRDFPAENPLPLSYAENSFVSTTDESKEKSSLFSNNKLMNSLKSVGVGLSAVGALTGAGIGLHQLLTQNSVTTTTTFTPINRHPMMQQNPPFGYPYSTMRDPNSGNWTKPVAIAAGGGVILLLAGIVFVTLGKKNKNQ